MLLYTKGGSSSTEFFVNHLKSKHRIHVTHESEDNKTIPAQEEILSQIVKNEMSLFEAATKKRSNNLEKLFQALITINPKPVDSERAFSATGLCQKTQKQTEWWKCALTVMRRYYEQHWKTVLNLINNSLIYCAGTNSSNFIVLLSFYRSKSHSFQNPKKRVFPGFIPQLPETRVLKFCLELETLTMTPWNITCSFVLLWARACQGCVGTLRPLCTMFLPWKTQQLNGTMCFTNNEQN